MSNREGIWVAFADISQIPNVTDFGIGYIIKKYVVIILFSIS